MERISPQQAQQDMENNNAMLVCGYDDEQKFQKYHLERALSLDEFEAQIDAMPKDQEVIFYCA
jgi:hypothetical protein